jgi:hypothetical protein
MTAPTTVDNRGIQDMPDELTERLDPPPAWITRHRSDVRAEQITAQGRPGGRSEWHSRRPGPPAVRAASAGSDSKILLWSPGVFIGTQGEKVATNLKALLIIAPLGILSVGAAGCNDDKTAAESSTPAASATASGGGTSTPAAPPSPSASPSAEPVASHKVGDSTVVLIDPNGKKYTRHEMVKKSAGMVLFFGKNHLPSDFCARSYRDAVKGGGKFPAGKGAYMDACQEGVDVGS